MTVFASRKCVPRIIVDKSRYILGENDRAMMDDKEASDRLVAAEAMSALASLVLVNPPPTQIDTTQPTASKPKKAFNRKPSKSGTRKTKSKTASSNKYKKIASVEMGACADASEDSKNRISGKTKIREFMSSRSLIDASENSKNKDFEKSKTRGREFMSTSSAIVIDASKDSKNRISRKSKNTEMSTSSKIDAVDSAGSSKNRISGKSKNTEMSTSSAINAKIPKTVTQFTQTGLIHESIDYSSTRPIIMSYNKGMDPQITPSPVSINLTQNSLGLNSINLFSTKDLDALYSGADNPLASLNLPTMPSIDALKLMPNIDLSRFPGLNSVNLCLDNLKRETESNNNNNNNNNRDSPKDEDERSLPLKKRKYANSNNRHSDSPTTSDSNTTKNGSSDSLLKNGASNFVPKNENLTKNSSSDAASTTGKSGPSDSTPMDLSETKTSSLSLPLKLPPFVGNQLLSEISVALQADEDGDLPLHISVVHENLTMIKKFVQLMKLARKSVDKFNKQKQTPLHLAVKLNLAEAIKVLLDADSDVNYVDQTGCTALHLAVKHQYPDLLYQLYTQSKHPAHLNTRNFDGLSPLHTAVELDDSNIVNMLLDMKMDIDISDGKSGRTALFHAVEREKRNIVGLLLKRGANPEIQNYAGNTAIMAAHARNLTEISGLLTCNASDIGDFDSNDSIMVTQDNKPKFVNSDEVALMLPALQQVSPESTASHQTAPGFQRVSPESVASHHTVPGSQRVSPELIASHQTVPGSQQVSPESIALHQTAPGSQRVSPESVVSHHTVPGSYRISSESIASHQMSPVSQRVSRGSVVSHQTAPGFQQVSSESIAPGSQFQIDDFQKIPPPFLSSHHQDITVDLTLNSDEPLDLHIERVKPEEETKPDLLQAENNVSAVNFDRRVLSSVTDQSHRNNDLPQRISSPKHNDFPQRTASPKHRSSPHGSMSPKQKSSRHGTTSPKHKSSSQRTTSPKARLSCEHDSPSATIGALRTSIPSTVTETLIGTTSDSMTTIPGITSTSRTTIARTIMETSDTSRTTIASNNPGASSASRTTIPSINPGASDASRTTVPSTIPSTITDNALSLARIPVIIPQIQSYISPQIRARIQQNLLIKKLKSQNSENKN